MIQIQLLMSVTATAKLEGTSSGGEKTHRKVARPPLLSDVVMAQSEAYLVAQSKHTTRSSKDEHPYWWINGRAYDLTDFVERHPGGVEAILLGRGRDCTAMVESYHAFAAPQVWRVLAKYRAPTVEDDAGRGPNRQNRSKERPQQQSPCGDDGPEPDIFYDALKERVTAALVAKGIDPIKDRGASPERTAYYVLIFCLWVYTGYMHLSASVLGSFLFAITGWLMGALGHDAGHFAASRTAWINEWGVWAMFFICNPILWQHQHTYGHHSYTNEYGRDPDLHHFDMLLRVHKKISYEAHFRYQKSWPYVMFAYLFVVFGTCFYIPWGVLSTGTLYGIIDWSDQDRPTKRWGMRLGWYLYTLIVIIVPLCTHPSWSSAVLSIYLHIATLGIVFALFSQINHLNEPSLESDMDTRRLLPTEESLSQSKGQQREQGQTQDRPSPTSPQAETQSEQPLKRRDPRLVRSWAAAQVETSNNFASQSLLWHVLSNGLNHQIEHHLFPGLNHAHLHHISPIVRATCDEFGVRYKSYDTWSDLMAATLDWFDKLSVDDDGEVGKSRTKKVA